MKLNIGLFNESFPPTIDGVANTVYSYADIINKNYGYSTVVTPKYPNVVDDYDFDVFRYSSIEFSKKLGYRIGNILPVKSVRELKNKKLDLIHVHSPFTSSLVADEIIRFSRTKIPLVFTYHTKFDIELESRIKIKPFFEISRNFIRSNINKADEVWVVSEGAVESLRNIGYKGKYRIMRNGTDFKKGVSSEQDINKLRQFYNIKDDENLLIVVGRMMWYKNYRLTLDALKILPKTFKYKMLFVGDGYDRPAIELYAKQHGIYDKCIFAGSIYDREKLRCFYSAADLFLFPSTYDTSGLVVMEAAATNLPSILLRGSCASETIDDGVNGFLCEESPQSMAEKIIEAFSDKKALKKIGENASESVYVSWDDAVKNAYKRYEEIVLEFRKKKEKRK